MRRLHPHWPLEGRRPPRLHQWKRGDPCWHRSQWLGTDLPGPKGQRRGIKRLLGGKEAAGPRYWPECPWRRRGCVSCTARRRGWAWCGYRSRSPCRGCKHRRGNRTQAGSQAHFRATRPAGRGTSFQSSRDNSAGFCLPPLGLPWKQHFVKGGAAQSSGDPQAAPYPHTLQGAPSGSRPLSDKPGKSHSGRSSFPASCLPSRQQGWQLWISQEWADASDFTLNARGFLSAPHDSIFTR